MRTREIHQAGQFQIAVRPASGGGFLAWAVQGRIRGDSPLDEEPNDCWFQFGDDRERLISELKREIGILEA